MEGSLRGIGENELRFQLSAHHRAEVTRLPPVRFNRNDKGHHIRSMKRTSTVAASAKIISGACSID